ncbi:MAG: hypothetical protein ACJA06_000360 [Halocynthiibacter sp.]|jgi:hypothetical protein
MQLGAFGHGFPYSVFSANGLSLRDVTLAPTEPCAKVAPYIEPFMDPFAASFLMRLGAGSLNEFDAIILLRESPGAVHAFHYGRELVRKGVLPAGAPKLILSNHLPASGKAEDRFNEADMSRLLGELVLTEKMPKSALLEPLERIQRAQVLGILSGAVAFDLRRECLESPQEFSVKRVESCLRPVAKIGPRYALMGGPLGNSALHGLIETVGVLALDQQALDLNAAQRDFADNPFAARQSKSSIARAIKAALLEARIDQMVWQVEPHDDLWGWLAPSIFAAAKSANCSVIDLGFLPRWPKESDLSLLKKEVAP